MIKRKVTISIVMLIASILLLTTTLFAWFIGGSGSIEDIEIGTTKLSVNVVIYKVEDFNFDGVPDLNDDGALSYESDANGIPIDYSEEKMFASNLQPGLRHLYYIKITNLSSSTGMLNISVTIDDANKQLAKVMSMSYKHPNLDYESQFFFLNKPKIIIMGEKNEADMPMQETPIEIVNGTLNAKEMILSINFATLAELKGQSQDEFGSLANLNDFLNKTCKFSLKIELIQQQTDQRFN